MINNETPQYYCPLCDSPVIWAHGNSRPGSKTRAKCGNNPTSSRLDWNPKTSYFCLWQGTVERKKDGKIVIYNSNGIRLRERNKR